MRVHELLYEMSMRDAMNIFDRLGVDVTNMSPQQIRAARTRLISRYHPDHGGDLEISKEINAAYDVLKKGVQSQPSQQGGGFGRNHRRDDPMGGTPTWAWAGYSGGMAPNSSIYREDFTDMNFIKETMWELSGHSKQEWSIDGFDGYFFRCGLTVYGSPKIFHQMAEAMVTWQTKGGNPYQCRAVFATPRRSKKLLLIYSDGIFYDQNPIEMEHESFNFNASNDQQFVRKLPDILDQLKAQNGG